MNKLKDLSLADLIVVENRAGMIADYWRKGLLHCVPQEERHISEQIDLHERLKRLASLEIGGRINDLIYRLDD
jgi:hypothetical protein